MRRLLTCAALAFTLWSAGAAAAPISVQFNGFENGYRDGSIYGVRNASVAAGQFAFDVINDGGVCWDTQLNAFCIDVNHNLVTGQTADYDLVAAGSSSYLNSEQRSLIGQPFDLHAESLGTRDDDAAIQLSLWEIMYDFGGGLNLLSGSFSSSLFGSARTIAQSWLGSLASGIGYVSTRFDLFVLQPNNPVNNQTLLTWREVSVPEPGTLGLLGTGLILIGARMRRRSQKAR